MSQTRLALVIANAVSSQSGPPGVGKSLVKRTAESIGAALANLPEPYAFEPTILVDDIPNRVLRSVDKISGKCRKSNDLFLLYYFGHGRLIEDQLEFIHRGTKPGSRDYLSFQRLLDRVKSNTPHNVLFVIDCCYAGAATEQIEPSLSNTYHLMACTTPTTRARYEGASDNPIGTFSKAFLDGLYNPEAASLTDDQIYARSLFEFAKKETNGLTANKQVPYMFGDGHIIVSKYVEKPRLVPGTTKGAHIKSAYTKILAIARSMGNKNFSSLRDLYLTVTAAHREAFLTPVKRSDGSIVQQLAKWTVLGKYIRFLRAIGAVDGERLFMTHRGVQLTQNPEKTYNLRLLTLIDDYLNRNRSSRSDLRAAMQKILLRRGLPTKQNVVLELSFAKGYAVNQTNLGIILDMCGYINIFGMPKRRDQVYFPWSESSRVPPS
jgi:hypothetical protein